MTRPRTARLGSCIRHAPAQPERGSMSRRSARDFPILAMQVHGQPLVYLDNAATSQKPRAVIDAITRYYETQQRQYSSRRAFPVRTRHAKSTMRRARTVQRFLNAADVDEIIFVRGTTEAINLVAQTYGRTHVGAGDEVLITAMEHHSNIVPWQMLCEEKRREAAGRADQRSRRTAPGRVRQAAQRRAPSCWRSRMSPTRWARSIPSARSLRWRTQPAFRCWSTARRPSPHLKIDVQDLDCDFYAFSGHKVYGPTGIGVLYGKMRAAECHAALSGRRRHDQLGDLREDDLQQAAIQVRGRHAGHRRRHWHWALR